MTDDDAVAIVVQEKSDLWPDSRWHVVSELTAVDLLQASVFEGGAAVSYTFAGVLKGVHYSYRFAAVGTDGLQGEWG